jgi:MFS family permease
MGFVYFGAIIVITMVFASANEDDPDQDGAESYSFDYWAIFTSASAEVGGTTLIILLVDRIGRIPSQALSYLAGGCSLLIFCILASQEDASRSHLIVFSFLARMFFMSANCATWITTAEILTTEIRTTGHSAANAVTRLSASLSPYLLTNATPYPVIGVAMFAISLSTATCVWNLPETKGLNMGAAAHHPKPADLAVDEGFERRSSYSVIKPTPV